MARFKMDILIRQQTNKGGGNALTRVGGWSEGWYWEGNAGDAMAALIGVSQWRAKLLTTAGQVVGQRVRDVTGGASTAGRRFNGTIDIQADIPQMSLLMATGGQGVSNVRRWALRGIADVRVIEGEYVPSSTFETAIQDYADQLTAFGFRFRCLDFNARQGVVDSIAEDGTVLFGGIDPGFSDGDIVQGLHILSDANDRVITGKWTMRLGVGAVYKLQAWDAGLAHGGRLRRIEYAYPVVDKNNFEAVKITTHKVGKDFFQFRGRASRRN